MKKAVLWGMCLGALGASGALAQHAGHGIDLRHGARELGVMVGAAYVCTPDDRKPAARGESETMFDMILAEAGHEVAYLFAVSVGYGAGTGVEDGNCDAILDYVSGVKTRMFLGGAQ